MHSKFILAISLLCSIVCVSLAQSNDTSSSSSFSSSKQKVNVFLPTSSVLHLAEMAAKDEGFPINNEKLFFFDLITGKEGKELVPGYISIGFYGNDHPIHTYSINKKTAQIVDAVHCEVFLFKDVAAFAEEMQSESGQQPLTFEKLADEVGCDELTVIGGHLRKR
jgi:hypothetical protein